MPDEPQSDGGDEGVTHSAEQQASPQQEQAPAAGAEDVVLDVPTLKLEKLDLEADDVHARVSLQANVLHLVNLNVGVDTTVGHLKIHLEGADARANLRARLEQVTGVINRALASIDRNPDILQSPGHESTGEIGGAENSGEEQGASGEDETGSERAVETLTEPAGPDAIPDDVVRPD